ncbi:MAG: cyclic pyranopterin monophosphate synthase MoaC [Elusimicrobia bacterium]|nr:cyclic pyranopterin monophosphate synthase MoaC [Elusimicrobiota bacterium]
MKLKCQKDNLRMIDVSAKEKTARTAVAEGFIEISQKTLKAIKENKTPKGDVFTTSKIAGIMAAKATPNTFPMCHPINMTHCDIKFGIEKKGIRVESFIKTFDRTGAEMEALAAAGTALLNIYDMLKAIDKGMTITNVRLLKKSGGKSGNYKRKD